MGVFQLKINRVVDSLEEVRAVTSIFFKLFFFLPDQFIHAKAESCPQFSHPGFHFLLLKVSERRSWVPQEVVLQSWVQEKGALPVFEEQKPLCHRELWKYLLEPFLPGRQGISLYQQ